MRRERLDHTLGATALINETYLRLSRQEEISDLDRSRFVYLASYMMKRVLVDHARGKSTAKRGKDKHRVDLDAAIPSAEADPVDVLEISRALDRLGHASRRQRQVVELRFFGGLEMREVAEVLSVSLRTVAEEWKRARTFLAGALEPGL
jgi:RNA polymerase sigma factor (TIGR02999 family)